MNESYEEKIEFFKKDCKNFEVVIKQMGEQNKKMKLNNTNLHREINEANIIIKKYQFFEEKIKYVCTIIFSILIITMIIKIIEWL